MHNALQWSPINYWEPRGASWDHRWVWNRLILLSVVHTWGPTMSEVHAREQCKCARLRRRAAAAAVSLSVRLCLSEALYDLHKLCTIAISDHLCSLCSFCSPTFLCTENIFQEFIGFSVIGTSSVILKCLFPHTSSKAGQNAQSLGVFEYRDWFCSSQRWSELWCSQLDFSIFKQD